MTATAQPTTTSPARARAAGALAVLIMVIGGLLTAAGVGTWVAVQYNLAQENITVADDSPMFAGQAVTGPLTAYAQAEIIEKHALEATGGKTYAELDREDPVREVAMNASFLRASLFTSVVAFGVALLSVGLGVTLILVGAALRSLRKAIV
jgi:uncharacterized membrane protein